MRLAFVVMMMVSSTIVRAEGLQVSPSSEAELEGLLKKLGERHQVERWCRSDCVTFLEARFEGALEKGALRFTLAGAVTSEQKAYVELFGTRPEAALDAAIDSRGVRVPLYWSGQAYSVVLQPGDFRLTGTLTFAPRTPMTLRVPGPVGLVSLVVPDADIVGTGERRGVRGATYQLTPKQVGESETDRERLRLQVERRFYLARDRTFSVTLDARGARPGQVIRVPLGSGETIEELDTRVATLRETETERWLDWVASGPTPTLTFSGTWASDGIELLAPAGAIKETWRVRCDDPYLCSFEGDAEKVVGETGHAWAPLPGQKLSVTWQALAPLKGVHTVAQDVALATKPVGRNLQQRLRVQWSSSSGSLVSMTPPADALISRFELDGQAIPILKDAQGRVQVSLPAGASVLEVDWELAGGASVLIRPPMPTFSEPVGTLWHRLYPPEDHSVLKAGGLAGSPRVALWPAMGACLVLAALVWLLCRWGQTPVASTWMLVVAFLGFAIIHPATAIPLALALGIGRWLARINRERHKLRILVEIAAWGTLVIIAIVTLFVTLQHALFLDDPMEVTSFAHGGQMQAAQDAWGYEALVWGAYLAGDANVHLNLPAPWALTIPVVVVRLVWAGWGVVIAMFLLGEGRLALGHLSAYWRMARWTKPKPQPKPA